MSAPDPVSKRPLGLPDLDFKNKNVFVRADFNVPLKDGAVLDFRRIDKILPSLRFIMERGGRIVLGSHLGRPVLKKGRPSPKDLKLLSLQPVGEYLGALCRWEVFFMEKPESLLPRALCRGLKNDQVILLENLRFHPGENGCERKFAQQLAAFADIYINEGFSVSHRRTASLSLSPSFTTERGAGLLFQKEIEGLRRLLNSNKRPFYVLLGGSKTEDKIPLLKSLLSQADAFFIGGAAGLVFLKAQGTKIPSCKAGPALLAQAKGFLRQAAEAGKKVFLPIDHLIAKSLHETKETAGALPASFQTDQEAAAETERTSTERIPALAATAPSADAGARTVRKSAAGRGPSGKPRRRQAVRLAHASRLFVRAALESVPEGFVAGDIGPQTRALFTEEIQNARRIFWNGPMGFFENPLFAEGTKALAEAVARCKSAYRVVGGGHSFLAVKDFEEEIDHISTGGGASLQFLQGEELPGLQSLL